MPLLSIPAITCIIPVRNQAETLHKLLRGINVHQPTYFALEIVVVDDASTEDIESLCTRHNARYIRNPRALGPAGARNLGARMAQASILFFMDADIEYQPGMLEKAYELLEQDQELAAVSFLNQPYMPTDPAVKNFGALMEFYWFSQYFPDQEDTVFIRGFTTRNGAVRKQAFRDIDGFHEGFHTNAIEDYDFGKRLSAEHKVCMTRSPLIYHHFPGKLSTVLRNYWVRTSLWLKYYLQHRPAFDPAQTSPGEAFLRICGILFLLMTLLALISGPMSPVWFGGGILAGGYYLFSLGKFLGLAHASSHGLFFPLTCLLIHLISSVVICTAGVVGGLQYVWHRPLRQESRP